MDVRLASTDQAASTRNLSRYHRRYYYRGNKQRTVTCSNCTGRGHLFKECKKPIQSFGVLAWTFHPITHELCVCLIQRRHTISYEAFIRGKYDLDELEMHRDRMTVDEKLAIQTVCWDTLYDNIMNNKMAVASAESSSACASPPQGDNTDPPSLYTQRERLRAKLLYEMVDIEKTFSVKTDEIKEPTWEFPKGRRFIQEAEDVCALREFYEETNVPLEDVTVINTPWIEERFCGINKRQYHNRYLLAFINPNSVGPFVDRTNASQMSEVQDARLFSFEDATAIIHPFHPEKRECLRQAYETIQYILTSNAPTL